MFYRVSTRAAFEDVTVMEKTVEHRRQSLA